MTTGPARYSIAAGKTSFVISRTLYLSIFSARPIQLTFAWRDDLVLRLGDEVQGVDDVVGVELLAIVELDALAQVELDGAVVDLPPGRRELALVLTAGRIAVDQTVPDVLADDHADAHVVEEGIDVLRSLVVGKPDSVVALGGEDRARRDEARSQREATYRTTWNVHGRLLPMPRAYRSRLPR